MNKKIGLLCVIVLGVLAVMAHAQMISATLTGVVSDATEAVVPHAKVTVTNLTSLDVRRPSQVAAAVTPPPAAAGGPGAERASRPPRRPTGTGLPGPWRAAD